MDTRQGLPGNRIHSDIRPTQKAPRYPTYTSSSKEPRFRSSYKETVTAASRSDAPLSYQPADPSNTQGARIPRPRRITKPDLLQIPNAQDTKAPIKIVFSDSLVAEPARSTLLPLRSRPPSPYRAKRRRDPSPVRLGHSYESSQAPPGDLQARSDQPTARCPQGHKAPSRPHTKSTSAPRITPEPATIKDLESHRKETIEAVSGLNSRVGALENTVAAALPIVAEARLLWMENTVIRAQTKLGTTRQALCQYCELYFGATRLTSTKYALSVLIDGHPKYTAYTSNVRARGHHVGLTLQDLKYLQERLESLGEKHPEQNGNQEAVLISPFGGGNESGDRVMLESFRSDSRHVIYARRMWRACYERVRSSLSSLFFGLVPIMPVYRLIR
jgi:hypothetical protein